MDVREFNERVEDCLPKLRNLVRKQIGHPEQTDDIVQEALTKGWQNRDSFKGESAFCTWLCSIAVRAAIDMLREQQQWRDYICFSLYEHA